MDKEPIQIDSLDAIINLIYTIFSKQTSKMDVFLLYKNNKTKSIYSILRSPPGINIVLNGEDNLIMQTSWLPADKYKKGAIVNVNIVEGWDMDSPYPTKGMFHSFISLHEVRGVSVYDDWGYTIRTRYGPDMACLKSSYLNNSSLQAFSQLLGSKVAEFPKLKKDVEAIPTHVWTRVEPEVDDIIKSLQEPEKFDVNDLGQGKRKINL